MVVFSAVSRFSLYLADSLQAWPLVLFLEPADLGRHRRRACLDASVIGLDNRRGADSLSTPDRPEARTHVVMQRALISFQRQRVVALLLHDLLGDGALTVQRVGRHDGALGASAS